MLKVTWEVYTENIDLNSLEMAVKEYGILQW